MKLDDAPLQEALNEFNGRASHSAENVFPKDELKDYLNILRGVVEEMLGRDLVASQRLDDPSHAQLVADAFLHSIVIELDKNKVSWNDQEGVRRFLSKRFCPRKIIIAAGKSSRLSPTELIHKQAFAPDRFSTNLRLSRCAASFGPHQEVVAIDSLTAYQILACRRIDDSVKATILEKVEEQLERLCKEMGSREGNLQQSSEKIIHDIKERLIFARTPTNENDTADVLRRIKSTVFEAISNRAHADYALNEVIHPVFREVVEKDCYVDADRLEELLGGDCTIALAKPYGPGEAYMAAARRLQDLGILSGSKYTMPVYNEYAAAILSRYPNIYFHSFLIACNLFNFNGTHRFILEDFPVITIGSKSPRDKVEDRGNILLTDSQDGPLPTALKEWRDMTEAEREDARTRFKESVGTGRDAHAINAGVFIIDTAWAMEQFPLLPNHPDAAKGKLHEYWYTDLVEIAWSQWREAKDKNRNPFTRIVFFGAQSPLGNKDMKDSLAFADNFHDMIREEVLKLGVFVDDDAKISVRPSSPTPKKRPPHNFERQITEIFGSEARDKKAVDQIHLLGNIYLDATVRVRNGTMLDGRGGEVVLTGSTVVGEGAKIRGTKASNSFIAGISGAQGHQSLDGFNYRPPRADQKSEVGGSAIVIDSETENCYVERGSRIVRSTVLNSHIAGKVVGSEVNKDVVVCDEEVEGFTLERRREKLSLYVESPDDYVPGAARPCELDEKNRKGILEFARAEITSLYNDTISEPTEGCAAPQAQAEADTDELFRNEALITYLTPEQVYRYAFARIRSSSPRSDPFEEEKQRGQKAVRQFAQRYLSRASELDLAGKECRKFFRQSALLVTKANFLDWQSKSARSALSKPGFFDSFESNLGRSVSPTLAIDDLAVYEDIVFSEVGSFLYLTDNTAEAELDAAMWLLLCRLGHRVVVAAKSKPIRGDATAADARFIVNANPDLKSLYAKGKLRVIGTGSDTYGLLFDKASREFELAFTSNDLKAMIIKGQANLYTTAARNKVKAPIVAKLLSKGMTAQRVTGVPSEDRNDASSATASATPHPIIAFIPYGERITKAVSEGMFEGDLAGFAARSRPSSS